MLELTLIVLFISCFGGYYYNGKFSNYLSIYSIVWIITTFFCSLKLYGQIGYSETVYEIVIIGDLCFTFGYFVISLSGKKHHISAFHKNHINRVDSNKKIWKYSLYICTIINLYIGLQVAWLLLGGVNWYTLRYNYYGEGRLYGPIMSMIITWFVVPITTYVSLPMLLLEYEKKNVDKTIAVLTILNVLLRVLITGGKGVIVVFVVNLLVYLLTISRKKKVKMKTLATIISSLLVFYFLNGLRSGEYNFEFLYSYLGITLPLMDHWIGVIDGYSDNTGLWGYGQIFFYGFLNIPISIIDKIDSSFALSFNNLGASMDYMVREGVTIFEGHGPTTNVYLSNLTYFYLDGRIWGVIIGSFLFGAICRTVEKMIRMDSNYSFALFILFSTCVFDSFIKWDLYTSSYVLSFLYLRLLYKTKRIKHVMA